MAMMEVLKLCKTSDLLRVYLNLNVIRIFWIG